MRKLLVVSTICATVLGMPALATAQERLGDGVMGAAAGAVVAGPVGAVVGGVVGYTHGPGIAHGLGLRDHRCYRNCYAHAHYYRNHRVYR